MCISFRMDPPTALDGSYVGGGAVAFMFVANV